MEVFLHGNSEDSNGNKCSFWTKEVEFKEEPMFHHLNNLSYTTTGYGSKLPTQYKVKFNNRWYRVYSVCCSNVSTEYIISNGEKIIVKFYS